MRRSLTLPLILGLLAPATALAGGPGDYVNVNSTTGHLWDLYLYDYYLDDGTDDTYDSVGYFYVEDASDSSEYWFYDDNAVPTLGEPVRTVRSGMDTLGPNDELESWQVWFLDAESTYARQTVFFRNTTTDPVTFDVRWEGNMGSDSSTAVIATSSGEALVDATDVWSRSWDGDPDGDPHAGFIWGDGVLAIDNDPNFGEDQGGYNSDDIELQWADVTWAAGETKGFTVVYFQAHDDATLEAEMTGLADLALQAHTSGLTDDEIVSVVNFDLSDLDGDGDASTLFGGDDCDDENADVSSLETETCDGVDEDCDGVVDNGVTTTYYPDYDLDGYGDENGAVEACDAPDTMWIEVAGDCDDSDDDNHPDAEEVCADGEDNDCDAEVDEAECLDLTPTPAGDDDDDDDGNGCQNSLAGSPATSAWGLLIFPLLAIARRKRG